jgi:hypothetical protein
MKINGFKLSAPLWIGAGFVLAPAAASVLHALSKDIVKAMIVGGVRGYRMVKATSIAASETVVELYEEAKAELGEPEA